MITDDLLDNDYNVIQKAVQAVQEQFAADWWIAVKDLPQFFRVSEPSPSYMHDNCPHDVLHREQIMTRRIAVDLESVKKRGNAVVQGLLRDLVAWARDRSEQNPGVSVFVVAPMLTIHRERFRCNFHAWMDIWTNPAVLCPSMDIWTDSTVL